MASEPNGACQRCQGSGRDGYRMHRDDFGNEEIEWYRCERCDGVGSEGPTMTDTPRPTPAELQTWRREAQDYLDGGRHTGTAPRMAPRILALHDALTAKDEALAEQNAELAGVKEVCDSWQQCGETLMKFLPSGEPVTRGTLPDVLWKRIPEIIREARVELGVYREADRRSHAESARLTFERDDLAREVSRRIDENIVSMNEHARLTAQVTELQQQLAEADAGDDVRAFERTVKEQSDRNVALQAQVEDLMGVIDTTRRDREAAEAQVTRLTEKLEDISVTALLGNNTGGSALKACAQIAMDIATFLAPTTPPPPEGPTPTGGSKP